MPQYTREPAIRVLASSLNNATHTFKSGDGDRDPKFAVLPTGVAANRVLFVGTLTDVRDVGSGDQYLRARITDATEAISVYAGQYQPEAMATMEKLEPPTYVAVLGKVNTFERDDGSIAVSLRPEMINQVSQGIRDRWQAQATARTLTRIEAVRNDEHPNPEIVESYDMDMDELRNEIQGAIDEFETREVRKANGSHAESQATS